MTSVDALPRVGRPGLLDVAVLGTLAGLTIAVAAGGWPTGLDRSVQRTVSTPGNVPELVRGVTDVVVTVANPYLSWLASFLVVVVLAARTRDRRVLRLALPPMVVQVTLVAAGKAGLQRPGPPGGHDPHPLGYFPSGHTATALVCAGVLVTLLAGPRPKLRRRLWFAVAAWTGLVAVSLVVHGYHWLSDVLASALLGTAILRLVPRLASLRPTSRSDPASS